MKFSNFLKDIKKYSPNLVQNISAVYADSINFEKDSESYGSGFFIICPPTRKCLLALRSPTQEDPNLWCNIGGGGEPGETPIQTAIREVMEEVKIYPTQYKIILNPIHINQNKPNFKFYTHIAVTETEITPIINNEHSDYGWFYMEELNKLNLHYGVKAIILDPVKLNIINNYLSGKDNRDQLEIVTRNK